MILAIKSGLDSAKANQHAKYLGQVSFRSQAIVSRTYTHNRQIALPGPP